MSLIEIKFNKVRCKFGIKQSTWNMLFRSSSGPYYFYDNKEENLRKIISGYFQVSNKDCSWNFSDIGYHTYDTGFFSNKYYVQCSNCNKGHISGKAVAEVANVKIVKENANPARPKNNFFSSDILEEVYVLWSIKLEMKCNQCNRVSNWSGVLSNGNSWGFSAFSSSFAKI